MRIVIYQSKIIVSKIKDIFDIGVELHLWQSSSISTQLQVYLFHMVKVDMRIAQSVNKIAHF